MACKNRLWIAVGRLKCLTICELDETTWPLTVRLTYQDSRTFAQHARHSSRRNDQHLPGESDSLASSELGKATKEGHVGSALSTWVQLLVQLDSRRAVDNLAESRAEEESLL